MYVVIDEAISWATQYVASLAVSTAIVLNKKLIKRWDSERELFYDDIAHVGPSSKYKQVKYAVELWSKIVVLTFNLPHLCLVHGI